MLTRREWLPLAGAGAGMGVLSGRGVEAALELAQTAAARKVAFPRGAVVRSVPNHVPMSDLRTIAGKTKVHIVATLDERKVFRAVGKASVRTGLPIGHTCNPRRFLAFVPGRG